jgi:hypothetical protein
MLGIICQLIYEPCGSRSQSARNIVTFGHLFSVLVKIEYICRRTTEVKLPYNLPYRKQPVILETNN